MNRRDIKTVMEDHAGELMGIPGVTGVALGETEDGRPCILVLVLTMAEETAGAVPTSLEEYPVRLLESGKIRPMGTD